jgi:SNF2 family DNA or RNA helicase
MKKLLRKDQLHEYQKTGLNHVMNNPFCGLFLEMGLGKTVTTLTAIDILIYEDLAVEKVLVIAPKRVAENVWSSEIENWEHLKHLKISRIIGSEKQRRKALAETSDIYTIGRDNIAWLCALFGGSALPFDMLVIDESSSFKNPKSQRFKALKLVQPSFDRVVLLTGTPAPNGLIDLWSQIYLLDRGDRLGKYISRYREAFFKPDKRNGEIIYSYALQKNSEQLIFDKIDDICMSMKKKDYLDLPPVINNYIEIPFTSAVQKQYNDFEKEQVLMLFEDQDLEEGISAVNAAALSNKLLQFSNGAIYDNTEEKNWHEVHKLKLVETENIIESAGGKPVLIFRSYRHDLERLMKHLKKYNPRQLKTEQDIKDWNAGKIQVLLMHPASGGHGLNLQAGGNIAIWFGLTWSLELYQQANARLDRQGQKNQVIIHHLMCKGTIDGDVAKAIEKKGTKQEGLMQAIKARIKKYK